MLLPDKVFQLLLQGTEFPGIRDQHASWGQKTHGTGTQGLGSGWAGAAQSPHLPSEEVGEGQAALVAVTQPGHIPAGR